MMTTIIPSRTEKFCYEDLRDFVGSMELTTHLRYFPKAMLTLVKEYHVGAPGSDVQTSYSELKKLFVHKYIEASATNPTLNLILDSGNWGNPDLIDAVTSLCFCEFTYGSLLYEICDTYVNSDKTIVLDYLYNHADEAPSKIVLMLLKQSANGDELADHYINSDIFKVIPQSLRRW
jgi:hypothetical protein